MAFLQLEKIKHPDYHYKHKEFEDFKNLMISTDIPFLEKKEGLKKMAYNMMNTTYNDALPSPHKMEEVIKVLDIIPEEKWESLSLILLTTFEEYEKQGYVLEYKTPKS